MERISVREEACGEECEAKEKRAKFWLKFLKEFDNYRACGLFANFPSKTTRNKVTSIKRPAVRRVKVFNHVRGTLHGRKKSRLLAGNKKKKRSGKACRETGYQNFRERLVIIQGEFRKKQRNWPAFFSVSVAWTLSGLFFNSYVSVP